MPTTMYKCNMCTEFHHLLKDAEDCEAKHRRRDKMEIVSVSYRGDDAVVPYQVMIRDSYDLLHYYNLVDEGKAVKTLQKKLRGKKA